METLVDFFIEQLLQWWQFTLVGIIILIGLVVDLFDGDDEAKVRVGFKAKEMPHMQPIPIPTKGKGFFWAVWTWLMGVRQWEITKDFHFTLQGEDYVIPKGFQFDGASVPKFLGAWLSPVGVLLMGGLVHDYAYRYACLLKKGKKETSKIYTQKETDIIFRDINIEVNGFVVLNYLAYWGLRLGGWLTWRSHRKNNLQAL
jgi:hypothetical protein